MPAAKYDLYIEQGVPFKETLVLQDDNAQPLNLTGYSARMQIRPFVSSNVVLVDASTLNSKIEIEALDGIVKIELSESDTELLIFTSSVYDLELVNNLGETIRLIEGKVIVSLQVTRGV